MNTYTDDEYREAARRLRSGPDLSVVQHGSVQRVGDGAFVEMLLWVPSENAEGVRQEREFNQRASKLAPSAR